MPRLPPARAPHALCLPTTSTRAHSRAHSRTHSRAHSRTRTHSHTLAPLSLTLSSSARVPYPHSGGQDDLVAIWDVTARALVARGLGHKSWVTTAAFAPPPPPLNATSTKLGAATAALAPPLPATAAPLTYRFATSAADCRVLLWEFTAADTRAAAPSTPSSAGSSGRGSGLSPLGQGKAAPFKAVPTLAPLVAEQLHEHPICGILVGPTTVTSACMAGSVKVWARPTTEWVDIAPSR